MAAREPMDPRALLEGTAELTGLSVDEAAEWLGKAARLQASLAAYLAAERQRKPVPAALPVSRLLTPQEAADRLSVGVRWLYRHADSLAFTVRLSPRVLRFHEGRLEAYLRQKRA